MYYVYHKLQEPMKSYVHSKKTGCRNKTRVFEKRRVFPNSAKYENDVISDDNGFLPHVRSLSPITPGAATLLRLTFSLHSFNLSNMFCCHNAIWQL